MKSTHWLVRTFGTNFTANTISLARPRIEWMADPADVVQVDDGDGRRTNHQREILQTIDLEMELEAQFSRIVDWRCSFAAF